MNYFVMSFIGGAIGSGIVVFFASHYFYRLGKKHGAEIERHKYISECLNAVDDSLLILPEKKNEEN